jgi:surface antigen
MRTTILLAALAAALAATPAFADRDKDESGHGRHGRSHDDDHRHRGGDRHGHDDDHRHRGGDRHAHDDDHRHRGGERHARDDDHRHRGGHGKHKEEFWEGNCKVTREFKHNGDYKEKRKCKGPEQQVIVVPARPVTVVPARPVTVMPARPVAVAPQPTLVYLPWMVQQQGEYTYKPQYRPAPVAGTSRCNSSTVGSVLGGLVGGALGNQIGKGNGRTLATIGGAVAGVLVGGEVGRRMDAGDHGCVGEVLEVAPAGKQVQWQDGPARYTVVPGQVNYIQGSYCRPYTLTVHTERGPQRQQGTACRRPDGVWIAG